MRRLILLIHDFSLVIQLLEANYTLNILVFLYWWQIILGTFPFSSLAARLLTHSICSLNIPYTMLLIIFEERLLHIGNHFSLRKWRRRPHPPHFPTKLAVVASFSYKIGGGGLIFLQNWQRRQGFGNITGGCSDMVWLRVLAVHEGHMEHYHSNTEELTIPPPPVLLLY